MAEQTMTSPVARDGAAELWRLTVLGPSGARDVVVDRVARVADLLDQLGLPDHLEALSPDGRRLRRGAALERVGVEDGAVLVAVEPDGVAPVSFRGTRGLSTAHAAGSRVAPTSRRELREVERRASLPAPDASAGGPPQPADAGAVTGAAPDGDTGSPAVRHLRRQLLLPLAAVVVAGTVLAAAVLGAGVGPVPGALLLLAALAVPATTPRVQLAAAVCAAAGAAVLADSLAPDLAGRAHVQLVAAAVGAMAASVLTRGESPLTRRLTRTVVVVGLGVAAVSVLALAAELPAAAVGVVALALSVPLARIVPDLVFDVDTAAMLDVDRLSTTAWSPRPRRHRVLVGRWVRADVAEEVRAAARHQQVVLAGVLGAVVLATLALVSDAPGPRPAVAALLGAAGLGLCLVARRYHQQVDRWLLRAAGLAAVGAAVVIGGRLVPFAWAFAVVLVLLVLTIVLVLLAPRVGRGWTSLGWGRLADVLEVLTVAAVLPLGIWAADLVPWIRGLVA